MSWNGCGTQPLVLGSRQIEGMPSVKLGLCLRCLAAQSRDQELTTLLRYSQKTRHTEQSWDAGNADIHSHGPWAKKSFDQSCTWWTHTPEYTPSWYKVSDNLSKSKRPGNNMSENVGLACAKFRDRHDTFFRMWTFTFGLVQQAPELPCGASCVDFRDWT